MTKFQSLAALLLRKLPSSLRTLSNCPPGRVLPDPLLRRPPSPKGPPKPRGPLTVLESSSCRDCASTLSTPAWSMKVTKPKPLRAVVRERQMVTRSEWRWRGASREQEEGVRGSPGSLGQRVPHHQTLLHLPKLAEVFAQPFCNHTPAFGPARAPRPSPLPRPLPPVTPAWPGRPRAKQPERSPLSPPLQPSPASRGASWRP